MSGYGYPVSNAEYPGLATAYQMPVPQYTQSQIEQYYAQYQCYPAQPYQIIPDFYVQPANVASGVYQQTMPTSGYDDMYWQDQSRNSHMPAPTSQEPSSSGNRIRTWTCTFPNCTSSAQFTRLADLQRHQSTVHGDKKPDFPCHVSRCSRVGDKGFTRRDHLVEHLRNFHHIDVPKRKPGERSAFPFGWPEGTSGGTDTGTGTVAGSSASAGTEGRGRITKPSRRGERGGRSRRQGVGGLRRSGRLRAARGEDRQGEQEDAVQTDHLETFDFGDVGASSSLTLGGF